jgi:DHHA1 domain
MDTEKLKAVTDIFVHQSCPDGLSSALLCAQAYHSIGMRPRIWFLQYGTEKMAKLEPSPNQMFCDITPPLDRWKEWQSFSPIVLDHHETAREATEGLGGIYGSSDQSGATLAYEHVFRPLTALSAEGAADQELGWTELAHLAPIRDTWQDSHPDWVEATGLAHALMQNNPYDLIDATREGKLDFTELFKQARREGNRIDFKARKLSETAHMVPVQVGGVPYLIGVFNCTEKLISDACNMLLRHGCDVAVSYFFLSEENSPKLSISVRTKDEISARMLCEFNKGGGHHRAAGFRIDDGLNASVATIVQVISRSLWEIAKKEGGIKPNDGRVRKTRGDVLQSLRDTRSRVDKG